MTILRDGLLGHDHFPAGMPVLAKPPAPAKAAEPPSILSDREYWILTVRPMLIAAGNLIESDAMKAEYAAVKRKHAKAAPVPPPAPEPTTPDADPFGDGSGDLVPF